MASGAPGSWRSQGLFLTENASDAQAARTQRFSAVLRTELDSTSSGWLKVAARSEFA
jgi:hypothetical protein